MKILSGFDLKPLIVKEVEEKLQKTKVEFYLYSNKNEFACQAYLKSIKKLLVSFNIPYVEEFINLDLSEEENLANFKKNSYHKHVLLARPLKVSYEKKFIDLFSPNYDPDMLTEINRGKLFGGDLNYLTATSQSVKYILDHYNINVTNKKAVVIGRSTEVGYPCFQLLNKMNAAVSLLHSKVSKDIMSEYVKNADIIILATGKSELLNREDLNPNQIIIDCGFNPQGGDLGFIPNEDELLSYTPVPKGVGSLTSYCLLLNAIFLEENSHK